jgi:RNA-directed DNA polymerase
LYVVDVDLKGYFDTIPHDKMMARIEQKIADRGVLSLIAGYLDQKVLDTLQDWQPERGTPQGAVISPLLANIYLDPLDHLMMANGFEMTRYADDMVIQCCDEQQAQRALRLLSEWVGAAGLELHPTKTRIVQVSAKEGFDFLGYHFQLSRRTPTRIQRWPREKSVTKFKDAVRDKTHRTNGHSLETIITRLNLTVRGFFEYFHQAVPDTFRRLDGWIRGRLRAILRRRLHKRGRANGRDHQRWPNQFFQERGLFSMARERALLVQSST